MVPWPRLCATNTEGMPILPLGRAEAGQGQMVCLVQQERAAHSSQSSLHGAPLLTPTLAPLELDPPPRTATVLCGSVQRTSLPGPRPSAFSSSGLVSASQRQERNFPNAFPGRIAALFLI